MKKLIITLGLLSISTTILAETYLLSLSKGAVNSTSIVVKQAENDLNYGENPAASTDWLTFFQSKGYLTSLTSLDENWNELVYLQFTNDEDLPQESLGVETIGDLRFIDTNLTHVDFMQGVKHADFALFYDSFLTNVDGFSSLESAGVIYLHNNELENINGLSKVKTVTNGLYIYNNPLVSDLSPLSNLVTSKISPYVRIDAVEQYTIKPLLGSSFCNGVINGEVIVYIQGEASPATVDRVCD
jgi:hypothetical protein